MMHLYTTQSVVSFSHKNAFFSLKDLAKTLSGRFVLLFCILLSACQTPVLNDQTASKAHDEDALRSHKKAPQREWIAALSIVNTTDNTFLKDGRWQSDMGPLTTRKGGLACDNVAEDMRFHGSEYRLWHVAPSDAAGFMGMKNCSPNTQGKNSEPSCFENWALCGRKVRVKCLNSVFCARAGEPSLASLINEHELPRNNYIPEVMVDDVSQVLGKHPKAVESVVLYITDFCPAGHSYNEKNNQCQRPQVDISTPAFLLMGKANHAGYINTGIDVSVELLDADDATPAGPEY